MRGDWGGIGFKVNLEITIVSIHIETINLPLEEKRGNNGVT